MFIRFTFHYLLGMYSNGANSERGESGCFRTRTLMVFCSTAKAVCYIQLFGTIRGVYESVEGIGKAIFFLYLLKSLRKAFGKFIPNRFKCWKKAFFPLSIEMLRNLLGKCVGKVCPSSHQRHFKLLHVAHQTPLIRGQSSVSSHTKTYTTGNSYPCKWQNTWLLHGQ